MTTTSTYHACRWCGNLVWQGHRFCPACGHSAFQRKHDCDCPRCQPQHRAAAETEATPFDPKETQA